MARRILNRVKQKEEIDRLSGVIKDLEDRLEIQTKHEIGEAYSKKWSAISRLKNAKRELQMVEELKF